MSRAKDIIEGERSTKYFLRIRKKIDRKQI